MSQLLTTFAASGHDLEEQIIALSWKAVGIGSLLLVIFVVAAAILKDKYPTINKGLFGAIVISVVVPTLILIGSTIYLNSVSYTKGPVHWHADFEVWACGNELELKDPTGFSNKIGTATLHEHDDKRIHLEGVPVTPKDASLGKFANVIGGQITSSSLSVPLNPNGTFFEDDIDGDGKSNTYANLIGSELVPTSSTGRFLSVSNGDRCGSDESEVQVFAYSMENDKQYKQTKIKDPASFVIQDESLVPPGDCIIIEFDKPKEYTDKLCLQFGVRDKEKCSEFGVEPSKREVCDLTDSTDYKALDAEEDKDA